VRRGVPKRLRGSFDWAGREARFVRGSSASGKGSLPLLEPQFRRVPSGISRGRRKYEVVVETTVTGPSAFKLVSQRIGECARGSLAQIASLDACIKG